MSNTQLEIPSPLLEVSHLVALGPRTATRTNYSDRRNFHPCQGYVPPLERIKNNPTDFIQICVTKWSDQNTVDINFKHGWSAKWPPRIKRRVLGHVTRQHTNLTVGSRQGHSRAAQLTQLFRKPTRKISNCCYFFRTQMIIQIFSCNMIKKKCLDLKAAIKTPWSDWVI